MIPGGLGSFDLVFLWGLQELAVSDEKALVLLLLYRIGYFLIPFFIRRIFVIKIILVEVESILESDSIDNCPKCQSFYPYRFGLSFRYCATIIGCRTWGFGTVKNNGVNSFLLDYEPFTSFIRCDGVCAPWGFERN